MKINNNLITSHTINNVVNNPPSNWKAQLIDTINDIDELLAMLQLSHEDLQQHNIASYQPKKFPLRVPKSFVAKMRIADPNDPLLLQVLPDQRALQTVTGYVTDPLAENDHNPQKGLIHKYKSRLLITVTGACKRKCFPTFKASLMSMK